MIPRWGSTSAARSSRGVLVPIGHLVEQQADGTWELTVIATGSARPAVIVSRDVRSFLTLPELEQYVRTMVTSGGADAKPKT